MLVPSRKAVLECLAHGLAVALPTCVAVVLFNGTLFSWHPTLMSLGYLSFMVEGVLTAIKFRPREGSSRVRAIFAHIFWQILAIICVAGGFLAIYENKVNLGKPHFRSYHAKVGLASLLGTAVAPLAGAVAFRRLGLLTKLPPSLHPRIKQLHRSAGMVNLGMATVAVQLALTHPAVRKPLWTPIWQMSVALLGVCIFLRGLYEPVSKPVAQVLTFSESELGQLDKQL
ncbi:hypothetical protein WJX84_007059 [Apatococcus fuscideae]|uniref:Cytochrome b561 domain-containing protein n=1 Tax=Apatococcus fuscideae TaxID=2026836 RepID=A0AAW1SYJ4_9CHLO